MNQEKCNIGGQAVIEGVMMRAPGQLAIAVRTTEGDIVVRKEDIAIDRNPILKKPFLRGLIGLYDALVLGIKALNFSVQQSGANENKPITKKETVFSLIIGLGLGVALFVFLPLWLTNLIFPANDHSSLLYNAVDGIIRVIFFIAYIFIISRLKDIQRVFEYHGAEHKSIFVYEEGMDLSVENARKMSRFHPRCGTSFLLIVMVVAIAVFSLIPNTAAFVIKFLSRIFFLPIIAGVSYEILKLSGKYSGKRFIKLIAAPGLWLQRLTTREPDDSQLEVAIASINAALAEDNTQLNGVRYV